MDEIRDRATDHNRSAMRPLVGPFPTPSAIPEVPGPQIRRASANRSLVATWSTRYTLSANIVTVRFGHAGTVGPCLTATRSATRARTFCLGGQLSLAL